MSKTPEAKCYLIDAREPVCNYTVSMCDSRTDQERKYGEGRDGSKSKEKRVARITMPRVSWQADVTAPGVPGKWWLGALLVERVPGKPPLFIDRFRASNGGKPVGTFGSLSAAISAAERSL